MFDLVEATAEHARRASAAAAAASAASPRSPGGEVEDITDAAARARAGAPATPRLERPAPRLPPAALPAALAHHAAQCSARVDDVGGVGGGVVVGGGGGAGADAAAALQPITLSRRAAAPPKSSYVLSAATKFAFLPAAHAHAFELCDAKSLLAGGSTRLLLRAVNEADATDWALAINTLIDTCL